MEEENVSLNKNPNDAPEPSTAAGAPPPAAENPPAPGAPDGREPSGRERFFDSIRSWKIVRTNDRVIGGVAGGLGRKWDIAPNAVRILFVISILFGGLGVLLYALGWAFLPEEKDGRIHAEEALKGHFDIALVGVLILILGVTDFDPVGSPGLLIFHGANLLLVAVIALVIGLYVSSRSGTGVGARSFNPETSEREGEAASSDGSVKPTKQKRGFWGWVLWPLLILLILMTIFVTWALDGPNEDLRSYSGSKIVVTSTAQAEDGFDLGLGSTVLDFRDLDPDGKVLIPIEAKSGSLTILVPEDLDVEALVDVNLGEASWSVGDAYSSSGGINISERFDTRFRGSPDIRFEVKMDAGSVNFK